MAIIEYDRLTLVLGAGASKAIHPEFGLGNELSLQILERTNEDLLKGLLFKKIGSNLPLEDFIYRFKEYNEFYDKGSIDHFISEVNEFPEFKNYREAFNSIAANSIAYHILGYEGRIVNPEFVIKYPFENSWYGKLINWMKKNNFFSYRFSNRFLKIVTFNYDRTLEYFLFKYFPDNENEVKQFIAESIVHVYGHVGFLPNMKD